MTTTTTLARLAVLNRHHRVIESALLDSLYAVRRITWSPTDIAVYDGLRSRLARS